MFQCTLRPSLILIQFLQLSGNNAAGYDANSNFDNKRFDNTQTGGPGTGLGAKHHNDPLYPSPNAPSTAQNTARGTGTDTNVDRWAGGYTNGYAGQQDTGAGMTGNAAPGTNPQAAHYPMRPQTDAGGNPINPAQTTHGGGAKRMEGKVERVVGTMIGSQNLKAKGLAKEQ